MYLLNENLSLFQNKKQDEERKEGRIRLAPAPGRGLD
jgi:hypothetical protein